jgi:cytochrome c
VKPIRLIIFLCLFLIACKSKTENYPVENGADITESEDTIKTQATTDDNKQDSIYQKGLVVVTMNDCANCHRISEKLVGPSFKDVAMRYKGAGELTIDTLAKKIIKGGTGQWGEGTMTPHTNLSLQDARTAVKYILLLGDK